MNDELDLSPAQLDALKEIGNIGAGNSATALSQVINRRIDMNVDELLRSYELERLIEIKCSVWQVFLARRGTVNNE